ncbi:sarcosine oxidase subunit gamma [Oricola cellulosilytica]|uniref:Sarcosine oxidase subunit gamma family protein n=1 Tax=Oricola cellulosilytica TaxID=1429082 RepID=A0A4R0P464_9HYPH|nr:sarcosine oxidase subunit gamma [Oricola cellulosilytica]TCD11396.1 sarcosine oxidase subunit gamma family protein [Oricola cellulosilytica]
MVEATTLQRTLPLEGRVSSGPRVTIRPAPTAQRVSLRASADAVSAVSKGLGVDLPITPKQSARAGARAVLWLGPDEWLVIEEGERDLLADLGRAKALYSAVDVSHRNTAIVVSGPAAADTLNAGCPQDLSLEAFPVGACSRTVLGKIEIVLYRTAEDVFRVECWRSFSQYAFAFLAEAARAR